MTTEVYAQSFRNGTLYELYGNQTFKFILASLAKEEGGKFVLLTENDGTLQGSGSVDPYGDVSWTPKRVQKWARRIRHERIKNPS
jgi:hypothetical protein